MNLEKNIEEAVKRIDLFQKTFEEAKKDPRIVLEGKLSNSTDILKVLKVKTHGFQDEMYGILIPFLEEKFEDCNFSYSKNMYLSDIRISYKKEPFMYINTKDKVIFTMIDFSVNIMKKRLEHIEEDDELDKAIKLYISLEEKTNELLDYFIPFGYKLYDKGL